MNTKLIALILSIFLFSCGSSDNNEELSKSRKNIEGIQFTDEQNQISGIETGSVQKILLSESISCKGMVEASPNSIASVSAPMNGYVVKINVHNGEYVKRSTTLLSLKHQDYIDLQLDYLQSKSELEYLKSNFDRQTTLNENNINAGKTFEKVKADYNSMRAKVMALKQKLKLINLNPDNVNEDNIKNSIPVITPISGYINEINVSVGQYIDPKSEILQVLNRDKFHLELQVFEKDIHKIKLGQKVQFECSNPDANHKHEAIIKTIGYMANENAKTIKVHAVPLENYVNLRHGMFLSADIQMKNDSVYVLPAESIVEIDSYSYVFIESGPGFYKKEQINKGISKNNYVEIKNYNNLKNKVIVTKGANYILAKLLKQE